VPTDVARVSRPPPCTVTPTVIGATVARGPLAEDTSLRVRNVWMQGASTVTERAVLSDMVKLAHRHDFQLTVQVHQTRANRALLRDLARQAGLPESLVGQRVRLLGCDAKPSGWMEDSAVLVHVGRDLEVVTAPPLEYAQRDFLIGFLSRDGYHRYDPDLFQGANAAEGEAELAAELATRLGQPTRQASAAYLEGGNVVSGRRADGSPFAIVGRDSVALTARGLLNRFTEAELKTEQDQLEANGGITDQAVADMAQRMANAHNRIYPGWKTTIDPESDYPPARRFLALHSKSEKEIAKELRLNRNEVVFLTQLDAHVDMQVRPLKDGKILVNHPAECLRVLDQALADPHLPEWQRCDILEMRGHAAELLDERGAMYDQVVAELRDAGLDPVPVGGVFRSDIRVANFMNAVAVTTQSGDSLYITNASTITPLSDAFERRIRELGIDHFELVGAAGGGPNKRCAAEILLGDGRTGGGIDCRELHF